MSQDMKDCGCKEGADGGMCSACKSGMHSKCVAKNCDEPDTHAAGHKA